MAGSLDKIDTELRDKIAERIKELRESSGKTQTEFALELVWINRPYTGSKVAEGRPFTQLTSSAK